MEATDASGIIAKSGRYDGTYARKDIAFICDYASINDLICLSNRENLNAGFIEQRMSQSERLMKLNQRVIHQMSVLESDSNERKLLK